ncbi:MAG: hypothetical protein FWD53_12335 [Phycisphaerales bacterium]|nr:hypothetical protein [Phycisphaerales bacterium]
MNAPLHPSPPNSLYSPKLVGLKRRALPIVSTTTAAMMLTGCGIPERMLGIPPLVPQGPRVPAAAAVEPAVPRAANSQLEAYAADVEAALKKVDAVKFKSAGRMRTATSAPPAPITTVHPAVEPEEVILASAQPTHSEPAAEADEASSLSSSASAHTLTFGASPLLALDQLAMRPEVLDGSIGVTVNTLLPAAPLAVPVAKAQEPIVAPPPPLPAKVSPVPPPLEPTSEAALEVLRKQVAAQPTLNNVLALALLERGGGGRSRDAGLASQLNSVDRQIYQDLLASLDDLGKVKDGPLADRVGPIVEATKRWQGEADIALPKLALATRVESYGVYTPIEAKFKVGEKQTVLVYCEVANFVSKKSGDWYETKLSQQETLATDDGLLLWRPNAEVVEDRSMNQRRDFYLVKKITIPDNLAVGKYALRMSVTDLNTNKIAVVNLPIEIVK